MRLHPAASRVARLAAAHPARLMAFDLLAGEDGRDVSAAPLAERRAALEHLMPRLAPVVALSPASCDPAEAARWLEALGTGRDGVVAKRLDLPYRAGLRDGMVKVKPVRTADCVVGGFRYLAKSAKSARSCSGCTTRRACSITSASPPRSGAASERRSPCGSRAWWHPPASPATRRAGRAAGARRSPPPGSRCGPSWSWRSPSTTSRAGGFGTARRWCASGPTRRRASAGWSRSRWFDSPDGPRLRLAEIAKERPCVSTPSRSGRTRRTT